MKKKFKFLIGASLMIASSTFLVPILTSCTSQSASSTTDDDLDMPNNTDQNSFIDNTQTYTNKINNPNESNFNVEKDANNWKDFNTLTNDVNNSIYNSVFQKISEHTILNDIYNMISTLGKNSKINLGIYANIEDISIKNIDDNWAINIKFKIYNTLSKANKYLIGTETIELMPKAVKSIELEISGKIQKTFYQANNLNKKLFFGYYFTNTKLRIDDNLKNLNYFKFNEYSLSLNKFIELNNSEVGYTDIEMFATQKLMDFTDENIKDEIKNTYDVYINTIENVLEPLQKILQNSLQTKNNPISLLEFLSKNSNYFAIVVNDLYKLISKNDDISLKSTIKLLFSNKKLSELLIDEDTKNFIKNLLNNFFPDFSFNIMQILDNINSENVDQQLDVIFEFLKNVISELNLDIDVDISNIFDNLKTKGFLSTIFENKENIVKIIKKINNFGNNDFIDLLIQLFESLGNESNNVFDLIYNLVSIKNKNNEYIFEEILSKLIPNNIIFNVIKQILFDNPNFTKENIINFIDVFANPMSSNKNGEVINWGDWFKSIKKIPTFSKNENEEIIFTYKFEFGQDIYLNIDKLFKLLPNNLSVGTTNIPIGIIVGALPDWISINKGDYIEIKQKFGDIEYDVIKINDEYKLSWQAFTNTTIDVNLPNTLKTIYETSTFGSSTLVEILNNIFYGVFDINTYFKPYKSSLNQFSIPNFNPITKNNKAIFTNKISNERLEEIKKSINDSINEKVIDNTEFVVGSGWFETTKINKHITVSNFDVYSLLTEYFNLDNYNGNFHIKFDVNTIIKSSSILTFNVPGYTLKDIVIQTPYYVYTDGGEFKNYFSINF